MSFLMDKQHSNCLLSQNKFKIRLVIRVGNHFIDYFAANSLKFRPLQIIRRFYDSHTVTYVVNEPSLCRRKLLTRYLYP